MSLVFDYDKKTKKINRIIRKNFGMGCNCFFCYDTVAAEYRLCFVETMDDKKHTPTQLINDSLNHLFFNNLNGPIINREGSVEDIVSYCATILNYYPDRKNFLLSLCNMFVSKFNMTETAAVSEANEWQQCILAAWSNEKNHIVLFLSPSKLDNLSENNKLYKMAIGLDVEENKNGVKFKTLKLDMTTLETTMLFYS